MYGFAEGPYVPRYEGSCGWLEEEEDIPNPAVPVHPVEVPADHESADYEPDEEESEPEEASEEDVAMEVPVENEVMAPAEPAEEVVEVELIEEDEQSDDEVDEEVDADFDEVFDDAMLDALVDESASDRDGDSEIDDPTIINGRIVHVEPGQMAEEPPRWARYIDDWSREMGRRPPFGMQQGFYHVDAGSSADRALPVTVGRIARIDRSLTIVRDQVRDLGLESRQTVTWSHELSAELHDHQHRIQTLQEDLTDARAKIHTLPGDLAEAQTEAQNEAQALRDALAESRATIEALHEDMMETQGHVRHLQEGMDEYRYMMLQAEARAEAAERRAEAHARAVSAISERLARFYGV